MWHYSSAHNTPNLPHSSGQVALVIVLIMVGLLTIGLSVAQQSSFSLIGSQQEEESTRVFNAAEAGIEEALSGNLSGGSFNLDDFTDISVDYSVTERKEIQTRVFEGTTIEYDVRGVSNAGTMVMHWSRNNDCSDLDSETSPASILAAVYYDDAGTNRVRYYSFPACNRSDGFADSVSAVSTNGYNYRAIISMQSGDQYVRIKPVYSDTFLWVRVDGFDEPTQAYSIRSQAENDLGDEVRVVEVYRTRDSAPSVFDNALFSGTTLVKNVGN